MNIVKFIENRFQELRLEESVQEARSEFSLAREAETMALQSVLKIIRTFSRWYMIPRVLLHFLLVQVGFLPEPEPVLTNKLKAERDADEKKKLKKLGMSDLKKNNEPEPA